MRLTSRSVLGALAAVVFAAGCGDGNPTSQSGSQPDRQQALKYAQESIQGRTASAMEARVPYRSLDELLGNVSFSLDGVPAKPITDLVVVGHVVAAEPGLGFVPRGSIPDTAGRVVGDGVSVPFDDPRALWRTQHLTVQVDETLSGAVKPGQAITVGLAVNGSRDTDAATVGRGLKEMGRAVWFLTRRSPVFAYDPHIYADVADGGLIAPVATDDRLTLPFGDPATSHALLSDGPTLTRLRRGSQSGPTTVRVQTVDGVARRLE